MADLERRLAELRKSISEMSDDELYAEIGTSRNNRRKPPPTKPKKVKAKTKSSSSKGTSSGFDMSQLDSLTPEQAAELLAKLQNNS